MKESRTAQLRRIMPDARLRVLWRSRWKGIHRRCGDPRDSHYHQYGGRGITVWPAWKDLAAFLAFIQSIPGWDRIKRPPRLLLDRIDNDKGYQPGNLRLVNYVVSANNRRPKTLTPARYPRRSTTEWRYTGETRLDEDHRARFFRYHVVKAGEDKWVRTQNMRVLGFTRC